MKQKLVFGLSAAMVAGAFWACGSGEVVESDDNLEGLAVALLDQITDAEVTLAIQSCEANPQCAAEMQNPPDFAIPKSSETTSSSDKGRSSSRQPMSSASVPQSSMVIVKQSSSSFSIASSTSNVPQSSSSVIVGPGAEYGTCAPVTATINRGQSTTWKVTKAATASPQEFLNKAEYVWTFADGTPATSTKTGNMSSDAITYATSGVKTASLLLTTNSGVQVTMDCSPLQVNGAAITGCKCKAASETVDVAEGGAASWSVTGCASQGANITTYTWGGLGVAGDGPVAAAVLAAKGDVVQPTLLVGNDDNTQQEVTCDAVKAIDSNIPDYEITASQAAGKIKIPAGKNQVHLNVAVGGQSCVVFCETQYTPELQGALTMKVGGQTAKGNYNVTVTLPTTSCDDDMVDFDLSAEATCGIQ